MTVFFAKKAYQKAAEALVEAVREAYPVGSFVNVTIGRATFDAEIVRHSGAWWNRPDEMVGRNLKTGKLREFSEYNINR